MSDFYRIYFVTCRKSFFDGYIYIYDGEFEGAYRKWLKLAKFFTSHFVTSSDTSEWTQNSFTNVSMIVSGCLNTFLPFFKIFDSCTPPATPFPYLFSLDRCEQSSKNHQKSSKIIKNLDTFHMFEMYHIFNLDDESYAVFAVI